MTGRRPKPRRVVEGYAALFDPVTRAAHLAVLQFARLTRDDGWPTPAMVLDFAAAFGVPPAELGAFFGLLLYDAGGRATWVDAVRGPLSPALATPYLSRGQARAYGFLKCATA